jgi:hypothetical protein
MGYILIDGARQESLGHEWEEKRANKLREEPDESDGLRGRAATGRAPGRADQPMGGGPLGTTGRGVRFDRQDVPGGGSTVGRSKTLQHLIRMQIS